MIQFGDSFNVDKINKNIILLKNYDELSKNQKKSEAFFSNFDLNIYLANEEKFIKYIYNSLNHNGLLCFNLITNNSFITLKKIFYEIDENIFQGSYRRFGPFHDIQNIVEKLNINNFKETVVSTENLELNYSSLKKNEKRI